MGVRLIFFLFLHENIFCGYLLEAPWRGTSNEYHNICFCGEIKKLSILLDGKERLTRAIYSRFLSSPAILVLMKYDKSYKNQSTESTDGARQGGHECQRVFYFTPITCPAVF